MAETETRKDGRGVTQRIAAYALTFRLGDLPAPGCENAKLVILDTIGAALAASADPIGAIIEAHVAQSSKPGPSRVLGFGTHVDPAFAALANGTLANALDFDEGFHVSTYVLPAALALAEANHASGSDFLAAFAAGYEIASRLTQVIDSARGSASGPTQRGFWHVGLVSPVAAAAVAARLLGLDIDQTRHAIGIATCSSGGFRRNMGKMAKALHSGNAARAGIDAALLAQRGFTGDPDIIEAPLGFARAICAPDQPKWSAISADLGTILALAEPAPIKIYPACTPIHPALDAILALRAEAAMPAAEIAAIESNFHTFSLFRLVPEDVDGLGFSAPFLLSAAYLRGRLGLAEISESLLHDPDVQALMPRVKEIPAEEKVVRIRFKDGKVLSRKVEKLRRLSDWDSVAAKFRTSAADSLSAASTEALIAAVKDLESQPDIAPLVALAIKSH